MIAAVWLLISLPGLLRAVQAGLDWKVLAEIPMQPGPLYLLLGGALWFVAALGVALALVTRRRWALTACIAAALLLTAVYWIERLLLAGGPDRSASLPFAIIANIVLLAWICISILGLRGDFTAPTAPDNFEVKA